jgi:hypothetical protein
LTPDTPSRSAPYRRNAKHAFVIHPSALLEQINIENVHLLCKDLPANPCHEIVVGGLCQPLSDNLKVNML